MDVQVLRQDPERNKKGVLYLIVISESRLLKLSPTKRIFGCTPTNRVHRRLLILRSVSGDSSVKSALKR